jgi:hypothetical protein
LLILLNVKLIFRSSGQPVIKERRPMTIIEAPFDFLIFSRSYIILGGLFWRLAGNTDRVTLRIVKMADGDDAIDHCLSGDASLRTPTHTAGAGRTPSSQRHINPVSLRKNTAITAWKYSR